MRQTLARLLCAGGIEQRRPDRPIPQVVEAPASGVLAGGVHLLHMPAFVENDEERLGPIRAERGRFSRRRVAGGPRRIGRRRRRVAHPLPPPGPCHRLTTASFRPPSTPNVYGDNEADTHE